MKKLTGIFGLCIAMMSCYKSDVPSLDEQKEGRWQIRSYTEERYQPALNTVSRQEVFCGPGNFMDFSFEKVRVHFDSTTDVQWSCTIIDHKSLRIDGKKWDIVKLDKEHFQLSLFDRDSTRKHRDVVRYELTRPWKP